MMKMSPYVCFGGDCEAAVKFYESCLGGQIGGVFGYAGSPMSSDVAADWQDKVMHGIVIGGQELSAADMAPGHYQHPAGFSLSLQIKSIKEAERIFHQLSQGGVVRMPLQQTFWSAGFAVLTDRFGIPWLINCDGSE